MTKKRPPPLPPAVLLEDLVDAPRRADRGELTWLRRPTGRTGEGSDPEGERDPV